MIRLLAVCAIATIANGLHAFVPTRNDIIFGLGTTFYGADFSVMYWGSMLQLNFGAACTGSYAVSKGEATLTAATPKKCVPDCFNRGMSVEIAHGVMHFTPHTKRCEPEAARVRVARIVDESTLQYVKDTDIIYFETYAV